MKYICLFLTILILCCCSAPKKGTGALPADHVEDTLLAIPEITTENDANENGNPNPYTFEFSRGTYYNMNDLTYFLEDTSIKSLRFYRGTFSDLSPLAELTELEELEITGNRYITNISPIDSLLNLKKLTLHNEAYGGNIEAISSLVNLRYLYLFYKDIYYRELLPLQKLEVLRLTNNSPADLDVTYIAQLHSLKELVISPSYRDTSLMNIEQLGSLVNLEKISIHNLIETDISWITSLQELKEVFFHNTTIKDINPLLELPNLITVNLYQSVVNDITPLLESKSIKSIHDPYIEDGVDALELIHLFGERGIDFFPFTSDR
jgi:hypothetical protein